MSYDSFAESKMEQIFRNKMKIQEMQSSQLPFKRRRISELEHINGLIREQIKNKKI